MTDDLRPIKPPRGVGVLHDDGRWVGGLQDAWVRWPSGEWRASVAYSVVNEWGQDRHLRSLLAERVRLPV
ncbi:hypothetical protein [Modestobacter marinus]|uniref:hypothetical protein n=1 Tax=Modestobacter marinus TaxID=477641 RepID=UPI001C98CA55|nr:hypothetical protein [Modestobacter marinus]